MKTKNVKIENLEISRLKQKIAYYESIEKMLILLSGIGMSILVIILMIYSIF